VRSHSPYNSVRLSIFTAAPPRDYRWCAGYPGMSGGGPDETLDSGYPVQSDAAVPGVRRARREGRRWLPDHSDRQLWRVANGAPAGSVSQ
jgi:hypothetical protein